MVICGHPALPPAPDLGDPDGDIRFAVLALMQISLSSTYLSLYFCGSDPGHVTLHLALTFEAWRCKAPSLALAQVSTLITTGRCDRAQLWVSRSCFSPYRASQQIRAPAVCKAVYLTLLIRSKSTQNIEVPQCGFLDAQPPPPPQLNQSLTEGVCQGGETQPKENGCWGGTGWHLRMPKSVG